ncbi:RNA-dependent RNA polymerase [Reticulomyxa filosa]|uniref:RNA-dependent RNA polymerase n=1 Tax=Reticulomyxa filosa TaxID=46433 RepID=X6M6L0_RETFI|nr:RNA-dependent RNA polymerase [Reticulomyxa filosa]|eukprot:ETO09266.1 RNA-dependent RNA polymerase [Reticulomyxa filosa]
MKDMKKNFKEAQSFRLQESVKSRILGVLRKYQNGFMNELLHMETVCKKAQANLTQLVAQYGRKNNIYRVPVTNEERRLYMDTCVFLSMRLKVEEIFLRRLLSYSYNQQRLNEKDTTDLQGILRGLWGGLKAKFKIQLPWPNVRLAGVADMQGLLTEKEVFLKVKIPETQDFTCGQCTTLNNWNCVACVKCGKEKPEYYIHKGSIGLMKNPCLHPGSYRLFDCVYIRELDEMFDGEVLVFSANSSCNTAQVHQLSGGDLDGDDFLCVMAEDLLPVDGINYFV